MKKSLNRKFSAVLALVLAFALMVGAVPMAVFAAEPKDGDGDGTINYVSIGDSMTNGYGFEGYAQGNVTNEDYDFINDVGVYGAGSYALQFEEYLKGKGYDVNHTKLAPSALLADDLLYLLGAREEEFDDDWAGYQHYVGDYDEPEKIDQLKAHFQTAITDADIITMCIGNASFGAYLVQQVTEVIGIMGGTSQVDPQLTLENGLALLEDEEAKKIVLDIYADMKADINEYIDGVELPMELNIDALLDLVAYTTASFMVSYEKLVDTIVEMNPDVEIILIGLMNTTYGMTITGEDFEFPFGDMMDNAFEALNNYIAGVPTAKQLAGEYEEATFYYAEQPEPDFIVQAFDDLAANNWENIDNGRLSGKIVRQRNIDAYNDSLRYAIGEALGFTLPAISLADIDDYAPVGGESDPYQITEKFMAELAQFNGDNLNELPTLNTYFARSDNGDFSDVAEVFAPEIEKEISIAIYLAIEEAVVDNVDTMDITVGGLMGIAGNIFGALGEMPPALLNNPGPATIKETLVNWFNGSENGRAMCKVYALFKVGNGMSVHPTPTGHDKIYASIVDAYENEYTAAQKTLDTAIYLITEYYDEAYAYGYAYALENGYITTVTEAIDEVIATLEGVDLSGTQMTDAFKAELEDEIAEIIETLKAAKTLIETADVLDEASLDALLALLNEAADAAEELVDVLAQAGVDVNNLVIIPAIEAAIEYTKTVVIPAAKEAAKVAAEKAYEYLMEALGDAFDYLVETTIKYLPIIDEALYNYLYNNPEEVIEFVKTYGPYLLPLIEEYGDEALGLLGVVFYLYGDEIVLYVIDNHEEILEGFNAWVDKYGDRIAAILQVYAEALGLCDAVRDQIDALEAILNNLYAQLENAVEETKAAIEAEIAKVKAQIEELKAQILYQMEVALKQQLDSLEDAVKAVAEAAIADLKALFNKLVYDATHIDATIDNDYKYVALGDATVVAEGYAEALEALLNKGAMENGVNKIDFVNAAIEGNTVANEIANLSADVADADLITLGFSQTEIMAKAMATMLNGETIDWVALVGEDVLPYVESALAEIYAMIDEQNLPADTAASLKYLIEAYAYGIAEYALNLPALINAIRTVNADAEIVIVGMYNPIDGVVIDINNAFVSVYMDLSDYATYFDYLIDGVAGYSTALAIAIKGVNYVDAREVEIIETNLGISDLEALLDGDVSFMYPGEAGHAYIAEQIYNAMIIEYVSNGILGDADMDGDVDNIDAMLILQYYTGVITDEDVNLGVCDVDGNGAINNVDAMLVLQYYTKEITAFPAA